MIDEFVVLDDGRVVSREYHERQINTKFIPYMNSDQRILDGERAWIYAFCEKTSEVLHVPIDSKYWPKEDKITVYGRIKYAEEFDGKEYRIWDPDECTFRTLTIPFSQTDMETQEFQDLERGKFSVYPIGEVRFLWPYAESEEGLDGVMIPVDEDGRPLRKPEKK